MMTVITTQSTTLTKNSTNSKTNSKIFACFKNTSSPCRVTLLGVNFSAKLAALAGQLNGGGQQHSTGIQTVSSGNPCSAPSGEFSRASALINESISKQAIPQLNQ
jgi:hypothetical protein